jgi:hypothetical protein
VSAIVVSTRVHFRPETQRIVSVDVDSTCTYMSLLLSQICQCIDFILLLHSAANEGTNGAAGASLADAEPVGSSGGGGGALTDTSFLS